MINIEFYFNRYVLQTFLLTFDSSIKMKKFNQLFIKNIFFLVLLTLTLFGCQGPSEESSGSTAKIDQPTTETGAKVSFQFDVSAFVASDSPERAPNFTADQVWSGNLYIRDLNETTGDTRPWTLYFDEKTWNAESHETIILSPGNYEFILTMSKGDKHYRGTAAQYIKDGTNDVALTVHPVIGTISTIITHTDKVGKLNFGFNAIDLSGITNPKLGVIVDGGAETYVTLNKETGLSNTNILLGENATSVELKLYDGDVQIGKSVQQTSPVDLVTGESKTVDFVALQGETTFSLNQAGGEAKFQFMVPQEIVQSAGSPANLKTTLKIAGPNNPLRELDLAVEASGDQYFASTALQNIQYDTVTVSLIFTAISESKEIGTCNLENLTLLEQDSSQSCETGVHPLSAVEGNILATTAINAISANNEPVQGASVYANGKFLGLTGSGGFGTGGYLKIDLKQGFYTIRVEKGDSYGETQITLLPLQLENLRIKMEQPTAITGWNFIDGNTENGLNWDYSKIAEEVQQTIFNNKLYAIWEESNGNTRQARVAVFNNDYGTPVWNFVDGNGGQGINKSVGRHINDPQLTVFGNKLYAIWSEYTGKYQVRVAVYNGDDSAPSWRFVDGDQHAEGINWSNSQSANNPQLTAFNNKLYATWHESNGTRTQIRVSVYNGNDNSPVWNFVDGSNALKGLNKNEAQHAQTPQLTVFSGKLYATWFESNGSTDQIRAAVYNGDDSAPVWNFIDGNKEEKGLNINSAQHAQFPQLTAFGNRLYLTWNESNGNREQIRVALYNNNDSAPTWKFVDGNVSNQGINKDSTASAITPQLTVFRNKLHATWSEKKGSYYQVRVAMYSGDDNAPVWKLVDRDQAVGLNKISTYHGYDPQIISFQDKLHVIWYESYTSKGKIRAAAGTYGITP